MNNAAPTLRDTLRAVLVPVTGQPAPHSLTPQTVTELALWSATADGVLDTHELDELVALLRELPGLERFDTSEAVKQVYAMAERYTSEQAIAHRVTELAMTIETPAARRASFQLAVWAASRGHALSEEETAFLEVLQDCLDIPDDEADALLAAR